MSVINSNIQAMVAARNLSASQEMLGRSLNRMSSGSKIVNPLTTLVTATIAASMMQATT